MIQDLQEINTAQIKLSSDVCIIGAGTAGIFLSQQLKELGLKVIVLECGGRNVKRASECNEECVQAGVPFKGAELGRGFGLGGTSALWGGQMIPLASSDIQERASLSLKGWPIAYSDLTPYFHKVKKLFSLDTTVNSDDLKFYQKHFPSLSDFGENFNLRVAEWLPFKSRNFSQMFSDDLNNDSKIEVWLNSTVMRLQLNKDTDTKYIQSIQAVSPNGKRLAVKSKFFAICAGTLESTRLVLALDESADNLLSKGGSPIGRYFADHLSVTCGKFECHDWQRFNKQIAPIFSSSLMRSPRLELTSSAQRQNSIASAFVHFPFITHGDTGFDLVRNFLRKQQGELNLPDVSPMSLTKVIRDMCSLALWRGFYRQLWIPRQADLLLQIDTEQLPNWNSRLYLSDKEDHLNRKQLVVDWKITSDDVRIFKIVANLVKDAWQSSPLRDAASLKLTVPDDLSLFESLYDVYHPTGSLRMGHSSEESVVDSDLKLWFIDNCFVSSTAVFPTAGSANPGLTHLALTARLAEHICKLSRR